MRDPRAGASGARSLPRSPWVILLASSSLLLALRLYAARMIGFGDSEALYASYALYPQPSYRDHPGLIGLIARAIADGATPTPRSLHVATAILATLVPLAAILAARACGASWRGSIWGGSALVFVPEIAIGLFGFTPDLPLVFLWYATIGAQALALRAPTGSVRCLVAHLGSGMAAGLAFDAKISAFCLLIALGLSAASRRNRAQLRAGGPLAAMAIAILAGSPVVQWEAAHDFPMFEHRIVETAGAWGASWRNLGGLFGGQLAYVGPPALCGAWGLTRRLHRDRHRDPVSAWLWTGFVATAPLILLPLLSRRAEPHWIAPLYLPLPLALACAITRDGTIPIPRRIGRFTAIWGCACITLIHGWVLVPAMFAFTTRVLGAKYQPRYDLANDLFAWGAGLPLVEREIDASTSGPPPLVIGESWPICAQLRIGLPLKTLVGCHGDEADFRDWLPLSVWSRGGTIQAGAVLYVVDDRFPDSRWWTSTYSLEGSSAVTYSREGTPCRTIRVLRLVPMARAQRSLPTGGESAGHLSGGGALGALHR